MVLKYGAIWHTILLNCSELKREILARSLTCFNDQGIEATTIETIRATWETSVAATYHHFGNKDGLVAVLFSRWTTRPARSSPKGRMPRLWLIATARATDMS